MSLLEVSMALTVASVAAAGVIQSQYQSAMAARARLAADCMTRMEPGVRAWLAAREQEYSPLLKPGGFAIPVPVARASASMGAPLGPSGLASPQSGGYLPATDVDTDPFGQTHTLLVREDADGTVEALLVAVGDRFVPDTLLGTMARRLGPEGGFIAARPLQGLPASTMQGTSGDWREDSATWKISTGDKGDVALPGHAVYKIRNLGLSLPINAPTAAFAPPALTLVPAPWTPGQTTSAIRAPAIQQAPFPQAAPQQGASPPPANANGGDAPQALVDLLHALQSVAAQRSGGQRDGCDGDGC